MKVIRNFNGSLFTQISHKTLRGRQEVKDFTVRLHDYLLSVSEQHIVSEKILAAYFGRSEITIKRAVSELKENHYLKIEPNHGETGYLWIVYDQPYDMGEMIFPENQQEITPAVKSEKERKFIPPSLEDCIKYFLEMGSTRTEAENFWHFYDSKDWFVGKNKMVRWHSAVSGWIARNGKTETIESRKMITDPTERLRGVNPDGSLKLRG